MWTVLNPNKWQETSNAVETDIGSGLVLNLFDVIYPGQAVKVDMFWEPTSHPTSHPNMRNTETEWERPPIFIKPLNVLLNVFCYRDLDFLHIKCMGLEQLHERDLC